MIATRASESRIPSMFTHRPNRSSNCGLSSPSSGFMVPTSVNRAGCTNDTPLTLDGIHAHSSRIQQYIDQMVVEEVHLIHVQNAPMSLSQYTGLEPFFSPVFNACSRLSVPTSRSSVAPSGNSTTLTFLSVVPRQSLEGVSVAARTIHAKFTQRAGIVSRQLKLAIPNDFDGRKDIREAAHGRGLGRPFFTAYEHSAYGGVDNVQG